MRLFIEFLRKYKNTGLLFAVFSLLFAGIFALYKIPAEPVLYAFLLCLFLGIIYLVLSFIKFRRQYKLLSVIYENLPFMTNDLPATADAQQKLMNDMVGKLSRITQEEISRLKSARQDHMDYFTVWVHQIKTPISAIQMILQEDDTDAHNEISAELFKIEQYAEMALQYIRLDSSVNDFVIKYYDVDSMIRRAVKKYAPLFIRRKIRLLYEPVSGQALTDEKWLVFVIEQLLSNAVKYTYSGSVKISFENQIIMVSDTGIGISPDDLPRIFEKGYTGMSGHRENKSTGLGLYLCKNVCAKLGHRIYADSEVGTGSRFYIDLSENKLNIE